MFRLVLFDIDGTLISTGGAGIKAFSGAFAEIFGLPGATENISFAGRTDHGLVREIFGANGIEPTEQNFHKFEQAYFEQLTQFLPRDRREPLPGVRRFMAAFRELNPAPLLGLLTGNHPRGAEIKLRHFGLWEEFTMGAFGDRDADRDEVARAALEQGRSLIAGLRPAEILVVGDTDRDIQCARTIGAKVLAVATGPHSVSELEGLGPDWVVADLAGFRPAHLS
jgi:phosphoglycolate phosphatase-like HAD superfamily hydrolase